MKLPILLVALLGSSPAVLPVSEASDCCSTSARVATSGPSGLYVEARTASVFAGACHYNSELVTSGAEALLAWSFDAGVNDGALLAGTRVAAIAVADRNFALEGAVVTSVLYVDGPSAEARAAAVREVRERHAAGLGEVVRVEDAEVRIELENDRYEVRIGELATLEGALMPDRACCTMPLSRWYTPLSTVEDTVVGNSTRFEHEGSPTQGRKWRRAGHNDAQVGRFAW